MGGISNDNLIFCPLWASAGSSGDSVSFKSQSFETVNWLAITRSVCAKQPARVYSHIFVASAAAFVRRKTHLKPAQLCFSFISLIKQWMRILKSAREQELRQLFFLGSVWWAQHFVCKSQPIRRKKTEALKQLVSDKRRRAQCKRNKDYFELWILKNAKWAL